MLRAGAQHLGARQLPTFSRKPLTMARPGLQALRDALDAERTKSGAARREARITKAIEDWRLTPRGQGHNGFFRLGAALQRAGVDEDEIEQTLRAEAPSGASGRKRRSEIKDILCTLDRRGFHALLTCGSPKQTRISWFCSQTVHAPANPKPLRSHTLEPRVGCGVLHNTQSAQAALCYQQPVREPLPFPGG
jgi:hypothetical protein